MIKLNWMIILGIVILLVFLYVNNSEHFAGALTVQNAEAVANISSMVNSGNMKVTNLEVTGRVSAPLTVNNGIVMQSTDKQIHNISLSRSDEQDKNHSWALWHMNQQYGQNDLSFWEYGHDKDGNSVNFGPNMIIKSTKKDTGKSGGVSFLKGADFAGPVTVCNENLCNKITDLDNRIKALENITVKYDDIFRIGYSNNAKDLYDNGSGLYLGPPTDGTWWKLRYIKKQ